MKDLKTDSQFEWLRNRGYLHVSDKINPVRDIKKLSARIFNSDYVASYAFFPLIHAIIRERRFKKSHTGLRGHSFIDSEGNIKLSTKNRPLHYASHMDAIIFSYYSDLLLKRYEECLTANPSLNESIIAYRKIPVRNSEKNKSTIEFAGEVFKEIADRAIQEHCIVLKFDIESYFSTIDHKMLKKSWCDLLGEKSLPPDHYNVFKGATKFSYILKDELRTSQNSSGRRAAFNEKLIDSNRKNGVQSFFESAKAFRSSIHDRNLRIYKFPFRSADGIPRGIPQGLPISATLSNLYLLDFDKKILNHVVDQLGGYYRRYSDDIIAVCKVDQADAVSNLILQSIKEKNLEISSSKTEKFIFKKSNSGSICCYKLEQNKSVYGVPFTYLGFEFYGDKTLIKSANVAKFYRRMIYAVKRKAKIALSVARREPNKSLVIFKRSLFKLYTSVPLDKTKLNVRTKWLAKNGRGEYYYKTKKVSKKYRTNYLNYVNRAARILNEPSIIKQISKHKTIFSQALSRHLNRMRANL